MRASTVYLARLIGLVMILIPLAEAVHGRTTAETITSLLRSPPTVLLFGTVLLIAGLAIVLGHNVWRGGLPAVVVTVIGWLLLFRGLLLLLLPPHIVAGLLASLALQRYLYLYLAVPFIVGILLTYAGFRAREAPP
jgi:hypothetical protein